jgi:hypothetical protein
MHIIYVDESGDDGFSNSGTYISNQTPTKYFIRVGIIIHDLKWKNIDKKVNEFKYKYHIPRNIELHASEIMTGRKRIYKKNDAGESVPKYVPNWYGQYYPYRKDRKEIVGDFCKFVNTLNLNVICVVIDKSKVKTSHINFKELPKNNSWEFLIERINLFLTESNDKRGMIISDAIHHQIEKRHRDFAKKLYSQSVHIDSYHFVESILFEPSDSSNLLQLADIVSYAFHRKFNGNNDELLENIKDKIYTRLGNTTGCGIKIWPE